MGREFDCLMASLENAGRELLRVATVPALIERAVELDRALGQREYHNYRIAIAQTLLFIYDLIEQKINATSLDTHMLPIVPGLHWDPSSPLAGALVDIEPFSRIDYWQTIAGATPIQCVRRQRRRRQTTFTFDDELVPGRQRRRPGPVGRDTGERLTEILPVPSIESPGIGTASNVLDVLSFLTGLAEGLLLAEVLGIFVASLANIIGLAAAWLTGDAYSRANGKLQGFSEALESMAEPFGASVDTQPLASWPAIPRPRLNLVPGGTVARDAWREGQTEGRQDAINYVQRLERTPQQITIRVDGELRRVRLTGKLFLRAWRLSISDAVVQRILMLRRLGVRNLSHQHSYISPSDLRDIAEDQEARGQ